MEEKKTFNPQEHLIAVTITNDNGEPELAPYLPEKASEIWFRIENPRGRIATEMIGMNNNVATFKARIFLEIDDVNPVSEATASRSTEDGKYFVAAAETAAVGRALSRLGYGTPLGAKLTENTPMGNNLEEIEPVDNISTTVITQKTMPLPVLNPRSQAVIPSPIPKSEINIEVEPVPPLRTKPKKEEKQKKQRNIDDIPCPIDLSPIPVREENNKSMDELSFSQALDVNLSYPSWKGKKMSDIVNSRDPKAILISILEKTDAQKFKIEHRAAKVILRELEKTA